MRKRPYPTSAPDYLFLGALALLVVFGLVMLASASSDLAESRFGNSYYYLTNQIIHGLLVGILGFFVGTFFYYRNWEKLAPILLILTIIMLILVFTPLGFATKGGATRWISIAGLTIQPAEILKLTFLLYLAAWFGKSQKRGKSLTEGFLPFIILIGVVLLLVIFQPSTTTAFIIFAAALIMYFVGGAHLKFLVTALLLAALALVTLVVITPYRLERIYTFLNPETDQLETGYHLNQSLIAIGSGGLFGVGYGNSTTKLKYLPEPIGDSIFAVIAEELGFVGALLLIALFLFFIWRGLKVAARAPDAFGRLLTTGFISLIGIQTFINIASASGLIPLTGVPLPFISFGGTALAVFLTMSGIIVNVSRYR